MATPIGIPGNTAIIPVNTQTVSKTITLPSVQTNPGRVIIIKDNTGNSATNNIFISTTGLDTLDKTFSVNTILSTSYGAWIFTNDGINTWFLVENYMNTLTLQNRNLLAPFPPFTVGLSVVENTFISTWTASINATSYSVSYYSNTIPQASGGTLLQTVQAGAALTNTIVLATTVGLYYYAVVTATNTNNSRTTTSLLVLPNLFPSTPTNIGLSFTTSSLICSWTPTLNTVSYTIVFYQNTSQSTTGSSLIQAITGLTVPFYTLTTNIIQNLYYYTTVQAVNLSALSPAVQSPYVISTIYPSPVTLLTILVYANNTLCRWQPAINATSYSVAFYQNATPTTSGGSLIETVTTTSAFQTSSAILTNGNYIYAIVTSLNQYGTSAIVTTPFTTTAITVPPVQPTTFMSGNATATWSAITNATSYTVFFYQTTTPLPSGGTLFYSAGSTASTTLTCAATLVNGYYYYATVQANNIYGSYPPRESQNTTAIIQNAPQPPSLVSISKVGTYLLASWTAGLNATSYTIIFYQNDTATTTGGSVFDTKTGQISTSQLSTINLINGKYYYATVQAINPYGSSTATTSATSTTQIIGTIPSAPSNVVISISGVNTVVTWTASANATTYSVTIFQNDTPSTLSGTLIESYNGLVSTSQTSSSILLNGKYYYAKVNAKNIYGSSYDVTTANTTAAISNAPQPPTNVSLVQNGTYFIASWAAAINATSYNITFYQNNSATTTGGSVFEIDNGNTGTIQNSSTLLLNGKYYYVSVTSFSSYNSLTSPTITSLFSSPAVTGINPSPTTSASIVLSGVNTLVTWNTAPNATSYIVTFYQNSSSTLSGGTIIETFTPGQAATTQTSSYILRNGTYIYATVISVNIYNNSVAVLTTTTTAAVSNAPQPPTNVSIVQSGTSVVATWTGAINATSYTIIFYQNNTATTTGGSTTQIFSYTNATQTWTAPSGVTSISVTMTGGGGGGGGAVPGPGALGGAGGYLSGTLTVTPGTTYTIYVAGGGVGALNSSAFTAGGFGGGGSSAGGGNTAGGGGGATYILNGSTLIVAVGGGGGGGYFSYMTGGNGGGQTGGNGGAPFNGTGGTQLAGGTVGLGGAGGTGSYLQGGNASDYYGGGGGGYYGGGAGLGGGGGSDYSTSLTNITQTQGGGATGGSGALALSSNKGVNGGNGSITILVSTKAPFETDNGNTGTSQSSSTILLNTYYYYATVTSVSQYNGLTSSAITSSTTTAAITGINPSPTSTALITLSGVNTLVSWSVAPNAISYTILLYQTATQTVSGGSLVETISGQVLTSQTTSYILRNGTYYYASITSVNIYNNSSAVLTTTSTTAVSNAPQPPTNVSIVQSGTSVVASWTGAINATSYTIIFYQNNTATTTGGSTFETDNGNTGTSQNSSTLLLNGKYYYATVTSFSSYNSTTSSAITSSTTTAAITGINPSPTTSASITLSGVNTLVSWSAAPNATSYNILLYETATQTVSGGSLVETISGQVSTTQTTSYILRNGKYYYASVTSVNIYNNSSAVLTTTSTTAASNAPQPPTNITVTFSGSVLSSSWTAAINATSYNVSFYYGPTNTTSGGTFVETDSASGTTQNLVAATLGGYYYYTTVTTVSSYNSTTSSTITSTNAAQITVAPSAPTNVAVSMSGYYGVCTWTTASNTTTYTVAFYSNSTATTSGGTLIETTSLLANNTTTKTATTLTPNNTYVYAIVTGVNGYASTSTTSATTTSLNQFAPTNPSNVTAAVSGVNVLVSWTASSFYATAYTIVLYNNGSTNSISGGTAVETITNVIGTSTLTTVSLVNGNYYYATVTATNAIPLSSSTITSSPALQAFLYLGNPTISVSNTTGLATISWTAIANSTTTYTLYSATGNNYTSGAVYAYGTTTSSSVSINTYTASYYYFTGIAAVPGGTTYNTVSSIVQGTYSAPYGPSAMSGLIIWNDASIVSGTTGTTVNGWTNLAGGTTYVTTTTGTLNVAGRNSQNTILITSGQTWTISTQPNLANYSMFWSGRQTGSSNQRVLQSTSNNQLFGYWSGQKKVLYIDGNPNILSNTNSDTVWDTMSHTRIVNGAYTMNWDGNVIYTGAGSAGTNLTGLAINAGTYAENSSVEVGEIILFNVVLTTTDIQTLEGYLAWKWGSQANLPVGHPYKSTAPAGGPLKLSGLSFTSVSTVSTISWQSYSNATGYVWILFQSSTTNFSGTVLSSGTTTNTTVTYSPLVIGTYYYVGVYATTATGNSGYASSPLLIIPTNPTNITVSLSTYYAVASWTATSNTVNYTVTFYQNSTATTTGGTVFETATTTNTTQTTVAILNNTYYYYATVQAKNTTAFSAIITSTSTTAQTQYTPFSPTNIQVSMTGNNITVSWTSTYSTSATFVLYNNGTTNSSTGGTSTETVTNILTSTVTTSATLINGNYYYYTIQTFNAYGQSAVITSSPYKPVLYVQNLSISIAPTTGFATLSWASISGATYTYVLYSTNENSYASGQIYLYGTTTSTTITLITYAVAAYYFSIIATTAGSTTTIAASSITPVLYLYTTKPSAITGLSQWLDAADPATLYTNNPPTTLATFGNSVVYWKDKTANGNNVFQSGTSAVPVYQAALMGNMNALNFQNSAGLISNTTYTKSSNVTLIAVGNIQNTIGSWGTFWGHWNPANGTAGFGHDSDVQLRNVSGQAVMNWHTNNDNSFNLAYTVNVNVMYSCTMTSGTNMFFQQTNITGTTSITTVDGLSWAAGTGTVYVGRSDTNEAINSYIGEIAYYQSVLTLAQRQQVEGYMAWKWGIQKYLPQGHPYVTSAPSSGIPASVTNAYLVTANNVATMTWSAFAGSTGYNWILIQSLNSNAVGTVISTGSVNSATLTASYTGLTLNTYYIFGVYSNTASTPSGYGSSLLTLYDNGVPKGGSINLSTLTASGGTVTITGLATNVTNVYVFYISTTTSIDNEIYTSAVGTRLATFTSTGANQTYVIPSTNPAVALFGAGGGSAGGYVTGNLATTLNETLTIIVGRAGVQGNTASALGTTYGGGGGTGNGYGDSGGGMASINRGATMIVVAGGAGGSGYGGATGGLGGGLIGGTGGTFNSPPVGGTGGTQSAGGTGQSGGANGAFGIGGAGTTYGGGGGGGYYGGGGGGYTGSSTNADGGGGGGSSYVANLSGNVLNIQGGGSAAGGNAKVIFGTGSVSAKYTYGQTISFSVTTLAATDYYAILVPSNSFGNGTPVVSRALRR